MTEQIDIQIPLKVINCGACGITYAKPWYLERYQCPGCAGRTIADLHERLTQRSQSIAKRDRTISALRGALARRRESKP